MARRATETEGVVEDLHLAHALRGRRRITVGLALDSAFFLFGTAAAAWLAYLIAVNGLRVGWWGLVYVIVFWVVLAYLLLPRIHSVLTLIYVPDYFIGRARTHEGLLGDPVNLALFGEADQIHAAMQRAGWTRADDVTLRTSWRIVVSTLTRRSYAEAPVSPLYVFGKIQDFAYQQEVEGNPAQRHHVRFWRCPPGWILPGGHRADWVAAGTYDTSVGLSFFTLQVTHRIDRETDVERDHIVKTLVQVNPEVTVHVIENFSTGYHSVNGGGDAIVTDGNLPQVDLRKVTPPPAPTPEAAEQRRAALTRPRRPPSILLSVALMALRIVSGLLVAGSELAAIWGDGKVLAALIQIDGIPPSDVALLSDVVRWVVVVGALGFTAATAFLAFKIYRGSYGARLIMMILTTFSIVSSAGAFFATQGAVPLTALLSLSIDVLVLVSLSNEDAREYVVGTREWLKERRAARAEARRARKAARP